MLQKGAIYWAAGLGVAAAVGTAGAVWRYNPPHQADAPAQVLAAPAPTASIVPLTTQPVRQDAPPATASADPQQQPAAAVPSPPKSVEASADKDLQRPQFDIVRVEPTGEAVIAGHAAPKAKVAITDQGRIVAEATADDTGQFAILPPPFAPGGHNLGLTASVDGGEPVEVSAPVAIDVPQPPKAASAPKVASAPATPVPHAAATPTPPARAPTPTTANSVVQPPTPSKPAQIVVAAKGDAAAGATARQPRVIVAGVAVEDAGRLVVTGAASAGAFVNLYLNGSFLANVVAGKDGRWSVTVQHGMKGGAYAIRADEIDRAKDSVISRAEVPFNYPERVASQAVEQKPAPVAPIAPTPPSAPVPEPSKGAPSLAAASPSTPPATTPVPALAKGAPSAPVASMPVAAPTKAAPPAPTVRQPAEAAVATAAASAAAQPAPTAAAIGPNAANAIVRDVDTTKVVRGDSLWRISSQHYGNGVRYKQIYAANAAQIRNPRLIYPGQIFVLPQPTPF